MAPALTILSAREPQTAIKVLSARTSPEGRSTPFMPCGLPAIPFQPDHNVASDDAECGRAVSSPFHAAELAGA